LAFWERAGAAERGFESTKRSIEKKFPQVRAILSSYGIETTRLYVEEGMREMRRPGLRPERVLQVLEREKPKVPLKVLKGSRKGS
jgi:hypothetical protein